MEPLMIIVFGGAALVWRELNKKDYGVLTPARDEHYRNAMEYCHDPKLLLEEAQRFHEHGLKAQAKLLKRRAEWRSRPDDVKKAHEDIFQKALKSNNIPAILAVADGFEGWTATKKAGQLRQRVQSLQEESVAKSTEASQKEAESQTVTKPGTTNGSGVTSTSPVADVTDTAVGDDT